LGGKFDINDFNTPQEFYTSETTNITVNISIDELDLPKKYEDEFTVQINKINETSFATGSINITEIGEISESIGFEPDYIEFTSFQQIPEISNGNNGNGYYEYVSGRNNNCGSNEVGWTLGAAVKNQDSTIKQRSLSAARNSDSTNGHRVASSTEYVINHTYFDREGDLCNGDSSRLRGKLTEITDDGFKIDIINKSSIYNEEIPYRAFSVGEGQCDVGFHEINSVGQSELNCGFEPNLLNLRSGQKNYK